MEFYNFFGRFFCFWKIFLCEKKISSSLFHETMNVRFDGVRLANLLETRSEKVLNPLGVVEFVAFQNHRLQGRHGGQQLQYFLLHGPFHTVLPDIQRLQKKTKEAVTRLRGTKKRRSMKDYGKNVPWVMGSDDEVRKEQPAFPCRWWGRSWCGDLPVWTSS